jgi:N-acetylmuramoyl-L-alanine amidase
LIEGKPLFDEQREAAMPAAVNGIQGKRVVLSPGHGRYDNGRGGWSLQRGYHWGIVEDYINLDLVIELNSRLSGSGADIRPARQLDKNAGNHGSGYPWWQMDGSEYVRHLGAPESVWKPNGLGGIDRDIAARPEYANWLQANALVSVHNNGGGGNTCPSHGTETWYDTSNGYQSQSRRLASLRTEWDANWCNRGVKGSNGGYGENRRFRGPAVIVELAFMDVKSDNDALKNARFRSIATAAIQDAIVEYFGGTTARHGDGSLCVGRDRAGRADCQLVWKPERSARSAMVGIAEHYTDQRTTRNVHVLTQGDLQRTGFFAQHDFCRRNVVLFHQSVPRRVLQQSFPERQPDFCPL